MNIQQKAVVLLLRSALSGESFTLPQGFDLAAVRELAREHQISAMLYYGAINCGISDSLPVMEEFFNQTCQNIVLSQGQLFGIDNVLSTFEVNGIDHMPLKGTLLKKIYPKPEMRAMSDADILIRYEDYGEKVKGIMTSAGFSEGVESDHELHWHSPALFVELHKRIIPSYNKDYYGYFGDGWRLAKPVEGYKHRYEMSCEDQYIYLFTHLAKHYRNGGIGIKHMTDLWVCRLNYPKLCNEYIKTELEKLQLLEFYENISATLECWFADGCDTPMTDFVTDFIFSSGAYGTVEGKLAASGAKDAETNGTDIASKSFKNIMSALFLPYRHMKEKYPIVKKVPILYPLFWFVRWFDAIFKKKRNFKDISAELSGMTRKNVKSFGDSLKYVGLNFNFKE